MKLTMFCRYPGVSFRPLAPTDIPALTNVINAAYSYQDAAKGEPRTSEAKLAQRAAEVAFTLAESAGTIVGCVYLEPQGRTLHFGLLTVTPAYRGKGLAEAFLQAIDEYANRGKFTQVELDYMSLAPWLKRYYERYGYAVSGRVTPWGTIDLVQMSKPVAGESGQV